MEAMEVIKIRKSKLKRNQMIKKVRIKKRKKKNYEEYKSKHFNTTFL